jgi:lysophospholipid acyltransferase (LPLAT)-like uncharacterized protein
MKTPKLFKRLLARPALQRVLAFLGAQYVHLVVKTVRWQEHNAAVREQLATSRQPFILCFWHNQLLLMSRSWQDMPLDFYMLISAHRDGQLISRLIRHFDLRTIEGSKNKQGALAFRTLRRQLKAGGCVGMTPDGPRGPRCIAGKGAVVLAHMAGVPLVPVAIGTSRRRVLRSWDRFLLAWPFGRGILIWGEPLWVPDHPDAAQLETCRVTLEQRLNALSDAADQEVGHIPVPRIQPQA